MPDQTVVLERQQWQQLMAILGMAQGPGINWQTVNPLLMAIGAQLQKQEPQNAEVPSGWVNPNPPGDGMDPEPLPDIGLQQAARRVPRN